MDPIILLLI